MKRLPLTNTLAAVITAAAVIMATAGFAMTPASTAQPAELQSTTKVIDESTSIVTTVVPEASGVQGTTEVLVVDALPHKITVNVVDTTGLKTVDTMIVDTISVDSAESFTATVRSLATGESIVIDTTKAQQQAVPVIIGVLVVVGIKVALKTASKAAIKQAAKGHLLALGKHKWTHIMDPKHNWSRLAKSKDEIADLMSEAMIHGTRSTDREHFEFNWTHRGQKIVVRTSFQGHISNGWTK